MRVSPHRAKFTIYSVGSDGHLSWVFEPKPLSHLEHWTRPKIIYPVHGKEDKNHTVLCHETVYNPSSVFQTTFKRQDANKEF